MSRTIFVIIILLAASYTSFFPEFDSWWFAHKSFPARVQTVKNEFQPGIVLPLFALEEDYPYRVALDEIQALGAKSVSIFITNYQEDIRSNTIYLNHRAAEASQLVDIIQYAHRRGLSVFLFPTLHLQHLGYKEWRGVLKPENPELWWRNYSRMIRFYTNLARELDVEVLSIGSELCSLEADYKHWSQIIRNTRRNYKGLITYSANWDHYKNISFAKDLDYLGINAYFGLTQKKDPSLDELLKAWEPAKKRIEEAYKEYKKRVVFTEIGYPSVDGSNSTPWNYFSKEKIDLKEQELCYQAFVKTWDPLPSYLHAVYFYNWWGTGGSNDRDYTPRGKPAEEVLRKWYKSL